MNVKGKEQEWLKSKTREGARMVKIQNQVIMQDLNVGKLYK